ncbi:MAG: hypothetical protein LBG47_10520 [Prevotellaceae bacterium]|jgi:hypothetical protein|nr:hypothetical protein [Prevotellaceae bacterium]
MTRIFMIYADDEPERSEARRSQMAKICENHKNPRHLCAAAALPAAPCAKADKAARPPPIFIHTLWKAAPFHVILRAQCAFEDFFFAE